MMQIQDGKVFYKLYIKKETDSISILSQFIESKNGGVYRPEQELYTLKDCELSVRITDDTIILLFTTMMNSQEFKEYIKGYFEG